MSLVGAVSLTNKEGLFLGSVNLDNLNLEPNQIVYSSDGINMSGLNVGDGLQKVLDELQTVGNPDIQLTSNSVYVNDNVGTTPIQTAIDLSTQSDVIYISAGSYGEPQVNINNKYNIALQAPDVGNTICELINGIIINGTSELIRLSNLQIKPNSTSTQINGVGRFYFKNVVFSGSVSQTHAIVIGNSVTKYMTFMNCEFDQYCNISISNLLAAPIYFINCNFGGATINFANASPLLVIMSNCSGLVSYPASNKATLVGLNVLTTGASQVSTTNVNLSTINGSAYPPASSGVVVNNQTEGSIPFCTATSNTLDCGQDLLWFPTQKLLSTNFGLCDCNELTHLQYITIQNGDQSKNNTNRVLTSDGINGMKWDENGGAYSVLTEHFKYGQQTLQSGSSIPLYAITGLYNKLPSFNCIYSCVFNFATSSNNCILTLTLDDTVNTPQVYTQSLSNNGHHSIPVNFIMPATGGYDFNFTITGAVDNGTISTDTNDFYNVRIDQVKGAL